MNPWRRQASRLTRQYLVVTSGQIDPPNTLAFYLIKYLKMETVFFPQAIVEISAAVFWGLLSREEALDQASELGFPDRPAILDLLSSDLKLDI